MLHTRLSHIDHISIAHGIVLVSAKTNLQLHGFSKQDNDDATSTRGMLRNQSSERYPPQESKVCEPISAGRTCPSRKVCSHGCPSHNGVLPAVQPQEVWTLCGLLRQWYPQLKEAPGQAVMDEFSKACACGTAAAFAAAAARLIQ